MRIAPNAVLTTDYRYLQKLEARKGAAACTKGPWYGTFRFQKGIDHSFSQLDEVRHSALRAKVGQGYSGNYLVVWVHSHPTWQMDARVC